MARADRQAGNYLSVHGPDRGGARDHALGGVELTEPLWVRVGGGLELMPGAYRHGPADPSVPPPGDLNQPLSLNGRLVGWGASADERLARVAAELGARLAQERRTHLVGRLDHKLRSSLLALQEAARAAAYGRPELLETVYDLAQEAGRRAAGLSAAAMDPKDSSRAVVLAAVLRIAAREALVDVPTDAIVWACEPVLVDMLGRTYEWLGGPGARFTGDVTAGWIRLRVTGVEAPAPLAVPELGEPLIRHLVETHLGGWLDKEGTDGVSIYLPTSESVI